MKKSFIIILIPLLVGLSVWFLSTHIKNKQPTVPGEEYTVIDSGLWDEGSAMNWMDDHRIMTYGINPEKSKKAKIYIWDINEDVITAYGNGGQPCYSNGYIYYPYKVKLNITKEKPYGENWKEGLIGNEKLYTKVYNDKEGTIWQHGYTRNKFDCKLSQRPAAMQNRAWIPLLEEHGYLDFGDMGNKPSKPLDVFLVTPDKKRKKLTFTNNQIGPTSGVYSPFKKSYFFWPHVIDVETRKQWADNGCLLAWWLEPDSGNSYSECIPYTTWTSSPDVIPTRPGLFITNDNYIGTSPGDSGGYLYKDQQFIKVITGKVTHTKVSPDGCKIAIAHRLSYFTNKSEELSLKVINICN